MATIVVQFGLATMPLGIVSRACGVDLRHHERHVGVHAPRRRVVDDDRAGRGDRAAPAPARPWRRRRTGRCRGRRSRRWRRPRPRSRCRPTASVRPAERAEAKRRISSTGKSRSASSLRMTPPTWPVAPNDADTHGVEVRAGLHRATSRLEGGRGGPARPARPRSSRTTHEMRIADVEIISMLMPLSASVSNIVAATPGFDFMPAPTRLTRGRCRRRWLTPLAPISLGQRAR